MASLSLAPKTLADLGVTRAHLVPALTLEGRRLIQAHLVSRGFDITGAIRVVELPVEGGFIFMQ
jgi:hypothetical protein